MVEYLVEERERERGLFNSDRMQAQINSDNTTVHAIKFTAYDLNLKFLLISSYISLKISYLYKLGIKI